VDCKSAYDNDDEGGKLTIHLYAYICICLDVHSDKCGAHFRPNTQQSTTVPESPAYNLTLTLSATLLTLLTLPYYV